MLGALLVARGSRRGPGPAACRPPRCRTTRSSRWRPCRASGGRSRSPSRPATWRWPRSPRPSPSRGSRAGCTFAPLVIACSACCCWVDLSPSAFWIVDRRRRPSSNAFCSSGRSTVSQRTDDFESGSSTATLPALSPPPPPLRRRRRRRRRRRSRRRRHRQSAAATARQSHAPPARGSPPADGSSFLLTHACAHGGTRAATASLGLATAERERAEQLGALAELAGHDLDVLRGRRERVALDRLAQRVEQQVARLAQVAADDDHLGVEAGCTASATRAADDAAGVGDHAPRSRRRRRAPAAIMLARPSARRRGCGAAARTSAGPDGERLQAAAVAAAADRALRVDQHVADLAGGAASAAVGAAVDDQARRRCRRRDRDVGRDAGAAPGAERDLARARRGWRRCRRAPAVRGAFELVGRRRRRPSRAGSAASGRAASSRSIGPGRAMPAPSTRSRVDARLVEQLVDELGGGVEALVRRRGRRRARAARSASTVEERSRDRDAHLVVVEVDADGGAGRRVEREQRSAGGRPGRRARRAGSRRARRRGRPPAGRRRGSRRSSARGRSGGRSRRARSAPRAQRVDDAQAVAAAEGLQRPGASSGHRSVSEPITARLSIA